MLFNPLYDVAVQNRAIVRAGRYALPGVAALAPIDISHSLRSAKRRVEHLNPMRTEVLLWRYGNLTQTHETRVEVTDEKAGTAAARLVAEHGSATVLNFANATEAGGGYLRGARAQEEDLCRTSALYACLAEAPAFYQEHHRDSPEWASHAVIWTPDVPVFRDDKYALLAVPFNVSFITAAAPMRCSLGNPAATFRALFMERGARILAVARANGVKNIVLGAFGCGAFKNDPQMVAETWAALLGPGGAFRGAFARVVFAVYDPSPRKVNLETFKTVFADW